jgi:uncharacterized protein
MPYVDGDRTLVNTRNRRTVARTTMRAEGLLARGAGLLAHRLAPGQALWLEPCNGVHTFGMRHAIDVIVLDREMRVRIARRDVRPWRIVPPIRGGRTTVELEVGAVDAADVRPGDVLRLEV